MAVPIAQLKEDHPQFYRVFSRLKKDLRSSHFLNTLFAINSTHVLIHYYAFYLYARPTKNYGSEDGFSKQTLNWLNTILFICALIFIAFFMVLLPFACIGLGVYGLIHCEESPSLNLQLLITGGTATLELIARVIWYIVGRLDNKDSIFTYIESFDFLAIPILGLFIWGLVEAACSHCPIELTIVNLGFVLNVLGVVGWGIFVLFRIQRGISLFITED